MSFSSLLLKCAELQSKIMTSDRKRQKLVDEYEKNKSKFPEAVLEIYEAEQISMHYKKVIDYDNEISKANSDFESKMNELKPHLQSIDQKRLL